MLYGYKDFTETADWFFIFVSQEISVLGQCRSPHITEYYGSYLHTTKLWIVMEYMAGGSVSDLVNLTAHFDFVFQLGYETVFVLLRY